MRRWLLALRWSRPVRARAYACVAGSAAGVRAACACGECAYACVAGECGGCARQVCVRLVCAAGVRTRAWPGSAAGVRAACACGECACGKCARQARLGRA